METDPYSDIRRDRIDCWDADNLSLSLFRYKPGESGLSDKVTQFILQCKNSDSGCLQAATVQVYDAIREVSEDWKGEYDCRYIVPAPSHIAHKVSYSSRFVCHFVAKMLPWLRYPEELLFRKKNTMPAHLAYYRERPSPSEHFESIGCSKADLGGAGVIFFDDVRTTGNTSLACKWRLQKNANAGEVVRLFLGRTVA